MTRAGRIGIAVWRFDRIDKAVRRFNAVGADAVLQRVGIVASCVNDERAAPTTRLPPSCRC